MFYRFTAAAAMAARVDRSPARRAGSQPRVSDERPPGGAGSRPPRAAAPAVPVGVLGGLKYRQLASGSRGPLPLAGRARAAAVFVAADAVDAVEDEELLLPRPPAISTAAPPAAAVTACRRPQPASSEWKRLIDNACPPGSDRGDGLLGPPPPPPPATSSGRRPAENASE